MTNYPYYLLNPLGIDGHAIPYCSQRLFFLGWVGSRFLFISSSNIKTFIYD
jgi:hypothetical protein